MLNNRIVLAGLASAAGVGAALRNAGAKFVELDRRAVMRERGPAISLPAFGGRRSSTPKLKRPRTSHDFAMIAKAQAKRDRKAAKLERDELRRAAGIEYQQYQIAQRAAFHRIAADVKAEAMAVARELELERAA